MVQKLIIRKGLNSSVLLQINRPQINSAIMAEVRQREVFFRKQRNVVVKATRGRMAGQIIKRASYSKVFLVMSMRQYFFFFFFFFKV